MKLGPGLVNGTFITRLNRFAALVDVEGEEVMVHVANSGRMREMFVPGYEVKLKPVMGDHRKTKFDLAMVRMGKSWASADARLPNSLVAEALERQSFASFSSLSQASARGDLRRKPPSTSCWKANRGFAI